MEYPQRRLKTQCQKQYVVGEEYDMGLKRVEEVEEKPGERALTSACARREMDATFPTTKGLIIIVEGEGRVSTS